ncbi:MAG: DegT/DnrJ/EryC1/StrS family aminotransferase [Nanoarchaeota archaeon]
MRVNFVDLGRQTSSIREEIDKAIAKVIDSSGFILGEEVELFEKEFANYCNVKYAAGVDNGTSALELSLRVLSIGEGDEVITQANTFIATATSITAAGAKPVLVDINPENYNIDIEKIEEKITKKTKAIIPVHLYGNPTNMDLIKEIAEKHELKIVEDSCQGHGAKYKGKRVGSFGELSAFSFYPGKNLGGFGDGGIVVSDDEELINKIKMMRNYGQSKKYYHDYFPFNRRLDGLQAAILRVKLKYLDEWNEKRRKNAKIYDSLLNDIVVIPKIDSNNESVYHLYVIQADRRDELLDYLGKNGISAGIHYPIPVNLQKHFDYLGYGEGSFPVTEKISKKIISLPMFPELKKEEIEYVCEKVREFFKKINSKL